VVVELEFDRVDVLSVPVDVDAMIVGSDEAVPSMNTVPDVPTDIVWPSLSVSTAPGVSVFPSTITRPDVYGVIVSPLKTTGKALGWLLLFWMVAVTPFTTNCVPPLATLTICPLSSVAVAPGR